VQGKKGHGAKFYYPITNLQHHLSTILYVDDTDLLHIDLTKDKSVEEVHNAIQTSVNSWGNLLIATGGVLQPSKCFYTIILFKWEKGQWKYADNTFRGEFGITVPLPRSNAVVISHRSAKYGEKTLDAMTSLDGNSAASIKMIQEKAQQWINAVRNKHLHQHNVWFLLKVQFWPRIGYGLCSLMATFQELENALHQQYFQILPLGGVVRTTPVESRSMDAGFFGVGLPHLGIEALIAMANKLLMHYGCHTATGWFMQMSYSLFYLELGLLFQLPQELYQKYGHLVTHLWMKILWEKLSMFNVHTVIADLPLRFSREGDQFIMQVLVEAGYTGEALRRLNRIRVSLQKLFLSDILTASGSKVSTDILLRRPHGEARSTMRWPNKQPTDSDMKLWTAATLLICPSRSGTPRIGHLIGKLHKVWRWFWNNAHSTIHHMHPDGKTEDAYVLGWKPNRFSYSHSQQLQEHGAICSVQPTLDGEHWHLLSTATNAAQIPVPSLFLEVLQSWGHTWLWEHMAVYGGVEWLEHAISAGTLVAVMDSSYICEIYPNLCLAAFVLECSKGGSRVFGSFLEALLVANTYRGELLGLMAIHLILVSINKINPTLLGSVEVVSDCLGALKQVTYLPPYRIPSQCCHLDILKTIMVHCPGLLFTTHFLHIKAHQDDQKLFSKLCRKAQLNCICDHAGKQRIAADGLNNTTTCRMFLLEPIGLFVGGQKMTSETGEHIRFWAHLQLACKYYSNHKLLSFEQFDLVDWKSIHRTLHSLLRLFQLWASKHVLGIAGTMKFLAYHDKRSPLNVKRCADTLRVAQKRDALPHFTVNTRAQTMDGGKPHTS
jgi:hypothetical protein